MKRSQIGTDEDLRRLIATAVEAARPLPASRGALELIVEARLRQGRGGADAIDRVVREVRDLHPRLFSPSEAAVAQSFDAPAEEPRPVAGRFRFGRLRPTRVSATPAPAPDLPASPAGEVETAAPIRRPRRRVIAEAALGTAVVAVLAVAVLKQPAPAPNAPISQAAEPEATGSIAARPPRALQGVPEVLDAATLSVEGRTVRLAGIAENGRAGSPDDLARWLHGRTVACTPAAQAETYACTVDGQDLARVVLYNGGGRASEDAPADLKLAEDNARAARLGLWAETTAPVRQ